MISSGSDVSELENVSATLRLVMSSLRITYATRQDATPEGELNALVAVYRFVLFDSQARRGDPHDLTNCSTEEDDEKRTTENGKRENLTWRD